MNELTHYQVTNPITQDSGKRRLGLIIGLVMIVGLMAIFGWKLFDSAQSQVETGPAPDFTVRLFDGDQPVRFF